MKNFVHALILFMGLTLSFTAQAGTNCSDKAPSPVVIQKALNLALETRTALDASGAQIALISRAGLDLSKYNLRYSHMGLVWRDHPEGRWLLVHELNLCGTASSVLFNEGLGNFFLDDLYAYETEILVPSLDIQKRIIAVLKSGQGAQLHSNHYNMVAYPFSTRYQNSNQWALEVLAAAISREPLQTRQEAQAWLQRSGYEPTTLDVSPLKRLGARLFKANIAFDDQPTSRISTVTTLSIYRFLKLMDPTMRAIIVSLPRRN